MLNSSTSTSSITTFDIDVFTDFSLFSHPNSSAIIFFFVATAYRFSKVFRKKSSSVGTAFVLHYPWSVIHSSVETATATETLQQVELHPGTTASTEKSKNLLLSEQQLVFAWNAIFFESRGKKQILEVPFLHCAAQLFGASLKGKFTLKSKSDMLLGKIS